MQHSFKTGLSVSVGSSNNRTKLTEEDVLFIRKTFNKEHDIHFLTKNFNLQQAAIYKIIRKHTWKHI